MRRHLRRWLPGPATVLRNRWLRPFAAWLRDPRLWRLTPHTTAGGVAVGLFCGLIPGPLQMPGAALGALLLRVNLPLALAATLYTNPLTILPLYLAAYEIGRLVSREGAGFIPPPAFDWGHWRQDWEALLAWLAAMGQPLGIGLVLLGAGLAAGGYLAVRIAWALAAAIVRRRGG